MTHHGRHRRRHIVGPLAVAVAAVLVLAGAAWGIAAQRGEDSPTRHAKTHVEAMHAAVARATTSCRTARDLYTDDVVAMHGAIQQWRLHVDAMTQLMKGKIDLDQAMAFWGSTRVEGKRSLTLWQRVDGRYQSAQASCKAPADAGEDSSDLQVCHQRQVATDTVLRDARRTLQDWQMHIKDMDALRAGKMSANHAMHRWDRMYTRGKAELARYDKDHRRMDRMPDCAL